jgi:hypothetical protein
MDAAICIHYRMPSARQVTDYNSKRAIVEAADKAIGRAKQLASAGKSPDDVEEQLTKEFSPDALLEAAVVHAEYMAACIVNIQEADQEDFHERGADASFEDTEFESPSEEGAEGAELDDDGSWLVWRAWGSMGDRERVEAILNRQFMFIRFLTHLSAGFGAVTVGKSGLRPRTEGVRTPESNRSMNGARSSASASRST